MEQRKHLNSENRQNPSKFCRKNIKTSQFFSAPKQNNGKEFARLKWNLAGAKQLSRYTTCCMSTVPRPPVVLSPHRPHALGEGG
jgi:hypothetical protein